MTEHTWTPAFAPPSAALSQLEAQRQRAYRLAMRHSLLVHVLRRLIPAGAVLSVAALVAASVLTSQVKQAGVEMGPVALNGSRLTMDMPRMSGFRKDGKPYVVTAKSAAQDVTRPGFVELDQITARLGADNDEPTHMTAAAGLYDMKTEGLSLSGGVNVHNDKGDRALLDSAKINLKAGELQTDKPVRITTATGSSVTADTMQITENGKVIVFKGNVRSVLHMQNKTPSPGASTPARTPSAPQEVKTHD